MKITKNQLCRVTLEPELEAVAALWPAQKRVEMGRKFARWGRQLKLSGKIMQIDARGRDVRPPVLKFLALRKAVLN